MNQLFGRSVPCLVANSSGLSRLLKRTVTYEVSPTGEKIMVSLTSAGKGSTKKEKWQRVRPMGREQELKEIKKIEMDERLHSDPREARKMASAKLQSLQDSLRSRGFCRETKPYNPPQNVDNIVENICKEVFPQNETRNWSQIRFNDRFIKFKFLTECAKRLNHIIPNSQLYLMKSVSDVLNFYSTPIRGINSYDELVRKSNELPQNLHVIPEPILFNEESDTYFGGVSAYPFSTYRIRGLRAKKKYPQFKQRFVWPDI